MASMTHRQRLEACLSGAEPDRVPVAFWRHFPVDDQTSAGLAAATLAWQEAYDWDLVKVTPESSFCLTDWGARDRWQGSSEGTRTYVQRAILHPEDWERLNVLDPHQSRLGNQVDCLRTIIRRLDAGTPAIQTIFNPLSQAKNLVGPEELLVHMRLYPDAVHAGLRTITETTRLFLEACLDTGIAGVFYAVQHAQVGLFTEAEYQEFGKPYDLEVLEPARDLWLNLLHLHGRDVMFDMVTDYPVSVLNWHDQETPPSLQDGQQRYAGAVCGGIRRAETLVLGTPDAVRAEAQAAIELTGGRRFILGTGCVAPIITPYGNLMAARQVVETYEHAARHRG